MAGRKVFCPGCGRYTPRSASGDSTGLCAGCVEADKLEADVPVSGRELEALREALGLDPAQVADLLSTAGRDSDSYARLAPSDVQRMEQGLVHRSMLDRLRQRYDERNKDMTTENGTDIEATTREAREALAEYERLNAEAMTLVADVGAAIDRLLSLGEPLDAALRARYQAYVRAVSAERRRAKAANDTSREDSINIVPWRPRFRIPAGVIVNIEVNPEMGVSLVPRETDDALSPARAVEYLGDAEAGVPFDAKARRRARVGA